MRVYFLSAVIVLLVSACGKKNRETFSGTVYDDSSHVVLANAEVILFDYNDYSANNLAVLESTFTGSDGKFSMTYNIRKSKVYALVIKHSVYNTYVYSFKQENQHENLIFYLKK